MVCAWAPPPRRIPSGLRAYQGVNAHLQWFTCDQHTTTDAEPAKTQTHSAKTGHFQRFSPNGSALWRPDPLKSRLHRGHAGGIARHGGPTRRRHAARRLRVVQNPRRRRCGGAEAPQSMVAGPPGAGGAGVVSGQGLFRGRWRADRRDKIRPARPLPHSTRDKIRPATSKTSNLGCFERAGRTFSRTGRGDVAILKPTTPLRPLMQANVKPPSPLRAPEQQPGGATLWRWGESNPRPEV